MCWWREPEDSLKATVWLGCGCKLGGRGEGRNQAWVRGWKVRYISEKKKDFTTR